MKCSRFILSMIVLVGALGGCAGHAAEWVRHEPFTSDDLHNGCFADARHGWIITHATGIIFATADGGGAWRQAGRVQPVYLESISFPDAHHGWLGGEHGALFRTEDAAETWTEVMMPGDSCSFGVVHFFDERCGLAAGTDGAHRSAAVFVTDDAGRTWRPGAVATGARGLTDALARSESGTVLIGGIGAILRSTDRGLTWSDAALGAGDVVRGLAFAGDTAAWAVGHKGLVLRSTDDGRAWRETPRFTSNRLRDVKFIDARSGFIVGDRDREPVALWQTTDGGETWTAVEGAFPDLHRIIPAAGRIWLIGDGGAIFSSPL